VNTTSALPVHPEHLTSKSDTPSTTTASPDRFFQDQSRRMAPDVDKYFTLAEMCDRYILCVLDHCEGNRSAAAQVLGIGRTTIYRYMKRLGCSKD
jgi:transcriptional regulator of acetoin/glycerol metabolism